MADPVGPHWELSKDAKTITVSFPSNPPTALVYGSEQIDDLLKNLGEMRAQMSTPHPPKWNPAIQKFEALLDPAWFTEPEMMEGNTVLHIRHPGFGWLNFLIPKPEAAKLASLLQAQVLAPNEPLGKMN